MAGYTNEGASDSQWFAASPTLVWNATKTALHNKKLRSCSNSAMRLEVNLGMSAWTGNCIASVSVQPAQQGGSLLRFSARMGALSRQQIGAQRRIEDERTKLFESVARFVTTNQHLAPPTTSPMSPPGGGLDIATQLATLAKLPADGALNSSEFGAAKARLLDSGH